MSAPTTNGSDGGRGIFRRAAKRLLLPRAGDEVHRRLCKMIRHRLADRRYGALYHARKLERKFGIYVNARAVFPASLRLPHPTGVVIGEGVRIGERVTIYQHVTLGGARVGDWQAGNYPTIGDDTVIFAGAVIVGAVSIGRHAVIGANAVVTKDVPDYATAAGVPARIVRIADPADMEVPR